MTKYDQSCLQNINLKPNTDNVPVTGHEILEAKRISHYSNQQLILLVGEGDFSFASSLATAFGSATNIVATSLDSKGTHIELCCGLFSLVQNRGLFLYNVTVQFDWAYAS